MTMERVSGSENNLPMAESRGEGRGRGRRKICCPGIGFLSRGDREIGVLRNVEPPTRPRLECDADRLCVNSAKAQLLVTDALLSNDAAAAKEIIANYKPQYSSIAEYLKAIDEIALDKDAVKYDENGNAVVDFQNI